MNFKEILVQFRLLGGIADNIELRTGSHGRGLFAVNPRKPVYIHTPKRLLLSPDFIFLDGFGEVKVDSNRVLGVEVVSFYEKYHHYFGWGVDGYNSIRRHQLDMLSLPDEIKNYLMVFGWRGSLNKEPTIDFCLNKYFINRQININSESRLMPIAELVNHSPGGVPYILDDDGVKLSGIFENEVFSVYHSSIDAFHFFINYHFPSSTNSALSCEVEVEVPQLGMLRISRQDKLFDIKENVKTPKIRKSNNEINVSFVEITNLKNPSLPKKTFVDVLTKNKANASVANEIFDGLVEHNQRLLADFIGKCDRVKSDISNQLKSVARYQLDTFE